MNQQSQPIGNQGSKEYKGVSGSPGTPGGVLTPSTGMASAADASATSTANDWAPLDAAFGNKPLYAAYKAIAQKAGAQPFCGGKSGTPAAGAAKPGMPGPATATMPPVTQGQPTDSGMSPEEQDMNAADDTSLMEDMG